jgi:hypothetical protein
VNLDEQPGPMGGVTDDAVRKELKKLWDVLHNRLGYTDPKADHVLVTQKDLQALKVALNQRIDALPIPPTVGSALIAGKP